MLTSIAWIVWGILLIITVSFTYGIIRSIQIKKPFSYAILIQTILFWIVVGIFYFTPLWNKFHIAWLVLLIFILSSILSTRLFGRSDK